MKMSMIIQKTIDNLWDRTFFRILPKWVTPNHLTFIRLIFVPIVGYFLIINSLTWAFILFLFAILTDSADGSLARKRNLYTAIGGWLDPIADKLLIIIFLIFLLKFEILRNIALVIIIIEVISIISSVISFFILKNQKIVLSDWWGKFKLMFQFLAILLVILFLLFNNNNFLIAGLIVFGISVVLSLASIFNHLRNLAVK